MFLNLNPLFIELFSFFPEINLSSWWLKENFSHHGGNFSCIDNHIELQISSPGIVSYQQVENTDHKLLFPQHWNNPSPLLKFMLNLDLNIMKCSAKY